MSLATLDASEFSEQIRSALSAIVAGKIGPVLLPRRLDFSVQVDGECVTVTWLQKIEADLPGVNPDLLRAKCYPDHAIIDLRISNLRVLY